MNQDSRKAIDSIIESRIKADVVKLLRDNPYIMDNLRGLSSWAALSEDILAPELDELVSLGVLSKYGDGDGAIFRYTNDESIRAEIDRHWHEIEQLLRSACLMNGDYKE